MTTHFYALLLSTGYLGCFKLENTEKNRLTLDKVVTAEEEKGIQ